MSRIISSLTPLAQRSATKLLQRSSITNITSTTTNITTSFTTTTIRNYTATTPFSKITSNTTLPPTEIESLINTELTLDLADQETKLYKDWKPGYRKRPLIMSHNIEDFENEGRLTDTKWIPQLTKRSGALGIKVGMMPVWDPWGERHACTVLYLDSNVVLKTIRPSEGMGYCAVQIGAGEYKKKNVTKPLMGHFQKCNVDAKPPYIVKEFRVTHEEYLPEPGTQIHARHFVPGQNVDVTSISKGKGFQGAMKKWNFKGMPATHGTSLSHRSLGSTGQCQDPGRVFKGKKMAGRMGAEQVTMQNLRVVKIDRGRNLIYVKGCVPGQKGEFVQIKDAVKRPLFGTEKVEGKVVFPPLPTFEWEEGVDGCGVGGFEVMMPLQEIDPFDPPMEEAA